MNHVFIINPESGKKRGLQIGKTIEAYLKNININYKIYYTEKKSQATEIAKMHGDLGTIVYSVGGDGTLNEIVNGLVFSDAELSIIPVGSGNDFYKSYKNFSGDSLDLGLVNDRYFVNVASLGFDAEIADYANDLKDNGIPNKMVYVLSLIKKYFTFNNMKVNVNSMEKELLLLAICNGSYYGGGFNIAPFAKLDDGLFDVYEADNLTKLKTLKLLLKLVKSEHTYDPNVTYYKSNGLRVNSFIPMICNVDGEIIKGRKFNFSLSQDAIKINNKNELEIIKILKDKKLIK